MGSASLSFELAPAAGGGTSITQTLDERYSPPVALFLRVAYNLTEGSIRKTLDEGLDNLRRVIESRQW